MLLPANTIILLFTVAGAVWLQVFLSKQSNKWLGLFLPVLAFAFSLLSVFNLISTGSLWNDIAMVGFTLLLSNVPTLILLVIYFVCREKLKKKSQLDKMNIQDLE